MAVAGLGLAAYSVWLFTSLPTLSEREGTLVGAPDCQETVQDNGLTSIDCRAPVAVGDETSTMSVASSAELGDQIRVLTDPNGRIVGAGGKRRNYVVAGAAGVLGAIMLVGGVGRLTSRRP